ncbi:recombinase family protein [Mesorhizobium sp. M0586]|uniref:recombinase family protein n=1 Tax=unclassified Mesorhizobium TaxID=325217 RepID=UPI00333A037F
MKIFAYVRVSTDHQANNGESLETQTRQLEGYAMMKGWTITDTFIEAGVSGSVPLAERPEGARMVAAVAKGDVILVTKLDRMFRDARDGLNTLADLKEMGVGLHMLDMNGDVTGNGISKMLFTILSAVAEQERDRTRERIRDVKQRLAKDGVYGGGVKPYGYDVVDGKLVPNPAEQAMLATMKAMKADGASLNHIGKAVGLHRFTVSRILARNA